MAFQDELYRLRKEHGFSQQKLAEKIGVSRQAISRWELGEVVPDTANILALSRVFGVTADQLLQEQTAPEREPEAGSEQPSAVGPALHPQETPVPDDAEDQALHQDIRAVNLGLLFRVLFLSACLALQTWQSSGDPGWCFSACVLGALSITGLARWNFRWYLRKNGSAKLLGWDILLVILGLTMPRLLSFIPGIIGTILSFIPGILVISIPIRLMLMDLYKVEPPGRRKSA